MGMYTELHLNIRLKKDTPIEFLDVLERMCNGSAGVGGVLNPPEHPLFKTTRWKYMLHMNSGYFDFFALSDLHRGNDGTYLVVHTQLKNYGGEIGKFLDWISPYIVDSTSIAVLGYMRYEESDEPTILRRNNIEGVW